MEVKKSEAKFVRQATTAVIAGRSLRAITAEINKAGARTTGGREFTSPELRDVLLRPRNMGYISHGQVGRKDFEIAGRANWEPIVDEDTWRAMFDILTDSSRLANVGKLALQWLGSGIYRCGLCGGKLRATASGGSRASRCSYRCMDNAHLMMSQEPTDAYIQAEMVKFPQQPRIRCRPDTTEPRSQSRSAGSSCAGEYAGALRAGLRRGTCNWYTSWSGYRASKEQNRSY